MSIVRRVSAVLALAVLAAAGACGWLALDRQIRVVKVEGQLAEAEAAQIRRSIGQVLEGRLLTMDVAKLRERVLALSWPGDVTVRKAWPDTIVVRVARRTVVARWADVGYLTPGGEIVSTPYAPTDVPEFDCVLSAPREAMEIYRYLQGMAAPAGLVIEQVSENEIGEWQLALSQATIGRAAGSMYAAPAGTQAASGADATPALPDADARLTVMLGADSLRERMRRFLVAWSRLLGQRAAAVDYVDLRYGNGIAVRWRESDTQHAGAMETVAAKGTT